ncbi:uncharacterized protein LOC131619441 [Vicia villosa]|uniref:uncharacterized protein LOC131619441 n=1 Tax=Vicia villosa TaxID=3911 RepID=UPI00273AA008|nr:uncharacterized protein LOC131619441 [Vicia villosa]
MSRAPILIKDLVKGNQIWKMAIRVVDLWTVTEKNGYQHIEMVIQDGEGDKIHVTTRNRDFNDWVQQVKEHDTFFLYNGEPVDNDAPLKVCSNPLKLVFNGGTTMTSVAIPGIPTHKFCFHPIENFLKGNFKHDLLYDVIGVLQDVVKTQHGGGGRKSCVNVTLRDVEGNIIELVLWDDYGKQFMNYTTPDNISGPTIVILTHAWCKPNTVSGFPCLSNAWNGSRLYINLEHPQVDEFKASFGATALSNIPALSQSLTCDSTIQPANNFWTGLGEVKSIQAISDLGKDCYATTIGTTVGLRASKNGWYFESCTGSSGNANSEPVTKFKVEVEVVYDGHKGIFVFWDKDCIPYTKLTAKEIREVMKTAGEDNPKIWPAQLDVLLNRELAFRIKYQSQYRQFSVVKILNEEDLYNKFHNYLTTNQNPTNPPVLENSTNAPNTNQASQTSEQSLCARADSAANHTSSPEASSNTTPAKRIAMSTSVNDIILAEELTPKQSATKPKPGKKIKHLKKE